MTPLPNDPQAPSDDAAMRALYVQAQDAISGGTTARLHRARHAAVNPATATRRGWAWPVAASCAALFALAIGVQVALPPADDAVPGPTVSAPLAVAEGAVLDEGAADAFSTYDESPDFYLWLAANEATLLAVE